MSEGQQAMARGFPVRLADGQERTLRFDLDALERLEADWGSLVLFAAAVQKCLRDFRGPRVKVVRTALRAGFAHLEIPPPQLERLITIKEIQNDDTMAAIANAWLEAIPERDSSPKASAETSASPGPGSTISAPSDTAAAIASGAV